MAEVKKSTPKVDVKSEAKVEVAKVVVVKGIREGKKPKYQKH